jgi:2,3-bisphosphoglycerate-dependent phosphoglycerate mutase
VPVKLLLVRHGQSTWNLENLFTGWTDVDLSAQGIEEARRAGEEIARAGLAPEYVLTSVLKRAIRTEWLILERLDLMWLQVVRDWRLNERHYGALQGLNKAQTAAAYGEAQVHIWRRSFDVAPPPLDADDPRHPRFDRRYAGVPPAALPVTESLKDTLARVRPCWEECVAPQLRAGRQVMIVAHGNSLRALVMMLDGLSAQQIVELNIPTGVPLLYELDDALRPLGSRYLGDAAKIAAAAEAVRRQSDKRG